MIEDSKRLEYWNFLISEKNQPRPKGITVQRLAVMKAALIGRSELWNRVIEHYGAATLSAAQFYQSGISSAVSSRADFWEAVRTTIKQDENKQSHLHQLPTNRGNSNTPQGRGNSNIPFGKSKGNGSNHLGKNNSGKNRRAQPKH